MDGVMVESSDKCGPLEKGMANHFSTQIPRKIDETKKPVTDWQLATFQNDYDPYRNPWMV